MSLNKPVVQQQNNSPWQLFLIFLKLGLTSFGGPIAHLGFFRDEFVNRRQWLTDRSYADLVALCHFLPGPASSQVGIAVGFSQARYKGAFAAWAGFTLPSAIIMIVCALSLTSLGNVVPIDVIHGLKVVTVAVVAQAVWAMARSICTDRIRLSLMALTTCIVIMMPSAFTQISVIIFAAILGMVIFKPSTSSTPDALPMTISRSRGFLWLALFLLLLLGLPLLAHIFSNQLLTIIDIFYRAGSLVFGGGHVVLPLLQAEVVPTEMVTNDIFLAGYGLAQALPGPLFTFSGFLGSSIETTYSPVLVGLISLAAIFAPSFLLVIGVLPFWDKLRINHKMQSAMTGINVAVVGLLLAALYHPVWTSAILTPPDFGIALLALIALISWKIPPWLVVIAIAGLSFILGLIL